MKVRDVMHTGATSVDIGASVKEIAKRMRESDVGAILVKADGHIAGIVTDRDIACRAVADSADVGKMTARDVMTKDVVCCSPEDDIDIALKMMEAKKLRRLPVADSRSALVGMLSLGDISSKLKGDVAGQVLRAVSAHHA